MIDETIERLGGLDIAVNNAGINFNNAAEDTPESEWDMTFNLNTKGVFLCCQVLPLPPDPHNAPAELLLGWSMSMQCRFQSNFCIVSVPKPWQG
jgi:hypothetical protein